MLLQPVDAADHGGLARARRPADDDLLPPAHLQIDVAQHMKLTVPLVDILEFYHSVRFHLETTPNACDRC
ncbi:hypothetical protein D3C84_1168710 [compost metagenome]